MTDSTTRQTPLNPIEHAIRILDGMQARHGFMAFSIAVVEKYGDDQCGRLSALIAFYGFFSLSLSCSSS
jgi:hypothetical protein